MVTEQITSLNTLDSWGIPLCDWKRIEEERDDGGMYRPIIVELYNHPLGSTAWAAKVEANARCQLTGSIADFSVKFPGIGVSAVVVRPGPQFSLKKQYKVTLYDRINFKSDNLLALTLGVYPDTRRFDFNDRTKSVRFEEAEIKKLDLGVKTYYDVSSYYA